jgi:hypothetical protein
MGMDMDMDTDRDRDMDIGLTQKNVSKVTYVYILHCISNSMPKIN